MGRVGQMGQMGQVGQVGRMGQVRELWILNWAQAASLRQRGGGEIIKNKKCQS